MEREREKRQTWVGSSLHCVQYKGKQVTWGQFPKSLMLSGVSHSGAIMPWGLPMAHGVWSFGADPGCRVFIL